MSAAFVVTGGIGITSEGVAPFPKAANALTCRLSVCTLNGERDELAR